MIVSFEIRVASSGSDLDSRGAEDSSISKFDLFLLGVLFPVINVSALLDFKGTIVRSRATIAPGNPRASSVLILTQLATLEPEGKNDSRSIFSSSLRSPY